MSPLPDDVPSLEPGHSLRAVFPGSDSVPPKALSRRRIGRLALIVLPVPFLLGSYSAWNAWNERSEWRRIESHLSSDRLEAGYETLIRRLDKHPDDARALLLAARTARRLERFDSANELLERCQRTSGVTDETTLEWDLLRVQQGDIRGIDTRLRQSIGPDHPAAPLTLEALARGYLRTERLADAARACEMWTALNPATARPWIWRGNIDDRLNNLEKAGKHYETAVGKFPEDPEARLALAGLLLRRKLPAEAAGHFEAALSLAPNDQASLNGLAECLLASGETERAAPLVERVLLANPESPRAVFLRGRILFVRDQPAEAESWLRHASRLAPDDPEPLYQWGQALLAQQKGAEADRVNATLGRLREDLVRLDELIRTVAKNPDDAAPRHEAGVISLRLGRTTEGLRWLLAAVALRGEHRETHRALAEQYALRGEQERSAFHRRLAESPPKK